MRHGQRHFGPEPCLPHRLAERAAAAERAGRKVSGARREGMRAMAQDLIGRASRGVDDADATVALWLAIQTSAADQDALSATLDQVLALPGDPA